MYLDDKQLDSGALGSRILADPLVSSELAGKVASVDLPYNAVVPAVVQCDASSTLSSQGYAANAIFNAVVQTGTAVNGYVEWSVFVAAGTYTLRTIHQVRTDAGILSISIDGGAALGTTIDTYAGSNTNNNITDITGIALTAGRHTIRYTGATKNASSTAFRVSLHGFTLTRTGA